MSQYRFAAACAVLLVHTSLFASEKESGPLTPADWYGKDRAAWMNASKAMEMPALKSWYSINAGRNTFIQAALANTRTAKADEYGTLQQRQAYYDLISLAIEIEPALPKATSGMRFFHATSTVTTRGFLGWVETPASFLGIPLFKVSGPTRELVVDINKKLFRLNVGVLNNVLFNWKELRSPSKNKVNSRLSALDFDLEMIDLEQSTVEMALSESKASPEAIEGLNKVLMNAIEHNPGMGEWNAWAAEAGVKPADFRNIKWRTAIGRAAVFKFHGKNKTDYLAMMGGSVPATVSDEDRKKAEKVDAEKLNRSVEAGQRSMEIAKQAQAAQQAAKLAQQAAALAKPSVPSLPPLPPALSLPPPPPPVISRPPLPPPPPPKPVIIPRP